jgi:hypothetical protein
MHASLTPRSSLVTIGSAVLVAVGTATLPGPFPAAAWSLAVLFGVVVGMLRVRMLDTASDAFIAAGDAVELRRAMMSRPPGAWSVALQWAVLPLLLGVSWRDGNMVAGVLGGFAVFMGVRDLVTLKAISDLASRAESAK